MSGAALVGLLWAAGGLLLGIRWWTERARWLATRPAEVSAARARFGRAVEDGSPQRLQAMLLAYALGAAGVALGLVTRAEPLLGLGVVLVNVGTFYRFVALALDHDRLEAPVLPPRHRPAHTRPGGPTLAPG